MKIEFIILTIAGVLLAGSYLNKNPSTCDADGFGCVLPDDPNRLLLKGGTNKTRCNGYSYPGVVFVDNYYNAEGVIDGCEMPPSSFMIFAFKQHSQEILNHTGTINVEITSVSDSDYYVIQVLTATGKTRDYPDGWDFCGNLEEIRKGRHTKSIKCSGEDMKFIKIINAPWNTNKNIYLDTVKVTRESEIN